MLGLPSLNSVTSSVDLGATETIADVIMNADGGASDTPEWQQQLSDGGEDSSSPTLLSGVVDTATGATEFVLELPTDLSLQSSQEDDGGHPVVRHRRRFDR